MAHQVRLNGACPPLPITSGPQIMTIPAQPQVGVPFASPPGTIVGPGLCLPPAVAIGTPPVVIGTPTPVPQAPATPPTLPAVSTEAGIAMRLDRLSTLVAGKPELKGWFESARQMLEQAQERQAGPQRTNEIRAAFRELDAIAKEVGGITPGGSSAIIRNLASRDANATEVGFRRVYSFEVPAGNERADIRVVFNDRNGGFGSNQTSGGWPLPLDFQRIDTSVYHATLRKTDDGRTIVRLATKSPFDGDISITAGGAPAPAAAESPFSPAAANALVRALGRRTPQSLPADPPAAARPPVPPIPRREPGVAADTYLQQHLSGALKHFGAKPSKENANGHYITSSEGLHCYVRISPTNPGQLEWTMWSKQSVAGRRDVVVSDKPGDRYHAINNWAGEKDTYTLRGRPTRPMSMREFERAQPALYETHLKPFEAMLTHLAALQREAGALR